MVCTLASPVCPYSENLYGQLYHFTCSTGSSYKYVLVSPLPGMSGG